MLRQFNFLLFTIVCLISCNPKTKTTEQAPQQASSKAQVQNRQYHSSEPKINILRDMLGGEIDAAHKAVKWIPTPGDVQEFYAQTGNGSLYTLIDTTFEIKRESSSVFYIIFHTSPMVIDEGEFVNSNSSHVSGVNLGYLVLSQDKDSLYIDSYKRNFASHGTFGQTSYKLSFVDLGDGYEYLKIDDPYEGMGQKSVSTFFYQGGNQVLSMISEEDIKGNRGEREKGYYEFSTKFDYDKTNRTVKVSQTGFKIDENTGKKIPTLKTKTFDTESDTWQF